MNSKKVTLVRPSYSAVYGVYGKPPKYREIRPPLGLMYIAGSLEQEGHKVTIIDAEPKVLTGEQLLEAVIKTEPDFVGFTSTTPEFHLVEELVRAVKSTRPEVRIIIGGAHVSALPEESLKGCPEIDYIVSGEGEQAAIHVDIYPPLLLSARVRHNPENRAMARVY